nr:low molecular weight protein-tyrosine-phosphatase [Aliiruegeria haliotis]
MTNPTSAQRILFVCLGNICRSPTADGVFRAMARQRGVQVQVDSAGTGAWHVGNPPDRRMQASARAAGYDLSDLRARQFQPADFDRFDLLLAMDAQNLRDMERQRPVGNETPARLFLDYGTGAMSDVPDPYYEDNFDDVLALIEETSERLLTALERGQHLDPS